MFFSHIHQLLSVGETIFGAVVCLIEDDVPCIFDLDGDCVFKPYIPVGSGESKKDTSGGMVLIKFSTAYAWLLDGDVGSEYTDMGEVGAATCVCLERGDTAW